MKHYYTNVPQIGNLAVTRHAIAKLQAARVPEKVAERVLLDEHIFEDIPDGHDVFWRQALGIRLVIHRKPTPFRGAMLVVTAFRIENNLELKA